MRKEVILFLMKVILFHGKVFQFWKKFLHSWNMIFFIFANFSHKNIFCDIFIWVTPSDENIIKIGQTLNYNFKWCEKVLNFSLEEWEIFHLLRILHLRKGVRFLSPLRRCITFLRFSSKRNIHKHNVPSKYNKNFFWMFL